MNTLFNENLDENLDNAEVRNKTLLVLEDDEPIRSALVELLETEGYHVYGVENGLAGLKTLELLGEDLPFLILLDLMMPIMNGTEFLHNLRQSPLWKDIPVVVLTAAGIRSKPESTMDLLRKPVHVEDLLKIIETYCRRAPPLSARRIATGPRDISTPTTH